MEETNAFASLVRNTGRTIVVAALGGALLALIVVGGAGYAAYTYRAELFQHFAGEYLARTQAPQTDARATSTADTGGGAAASSQLENVFSLEDRITETVDTASPAVVSVIASREVPVVERFYRRYDPFGQGGPSFRIPDYRQRGTEQQQVGGGSGFFVSADGMIVTNRHVVADDSLDYTAITNDGDRYPVTVMAKDSFLDIAVLRIENATTTFPHLQFGDSDRVQPGQFAIAIGNALGEFRNSVSVGVVSGLSRSIVAGSRTGQSEQLDRLIQTDAAINPGNSGGPLLNSRGQVIGVNVARATGEDIGFALPANDVQRIVRSVKESGEIVRPFLGVRYVTITERMAEQNDLPVEYGALIRRGGRAGELAVVPGSPADQAGLVENDIILTVDGTRVTREISLAELIRRHEVGEQITLTILHDGEEKTVTATLEKAPASQ